MNVLSIQSHVAYGHVGNASAVFPMQRLGVEVWPIHTVQFSNHTGYGSWKGRVFDGPAIEDLVEEIVGDISDEHDTDEEQLIKRQDDNIYVADARVHISVVDKLLGVDLLPDEEEDEADTLGGLIFEMAGRVPARGEIIKHGSGLEFEILQSDARRVKRIRVHVKKPPISADDGAADTTG